MDASLLALFFDAQDACEAGDTRADTKLQALADAIGGGEGRVPAPCAWPRDAALPLPPPSLLLSAALNGRAELQLDKAAALGFPLLARASAPAREAEADWTCGLMAAWLRTSARGATLAQPVGAAARLTRRVAAERARDDEPRPAAARRRRRRGYDVTYFRAGVRGANLNDRPEAF